MFVSYSRSDFYFAEQLAVELRRLELEVWFDVHELSPGSDWAAAIDDAIEQCDVFVFVASRASQASEYVRREREIAARFDRPEVAVLAGRVRGPGQMPTYDLRGWFRRGATRLASDVAAGTLDGWRPSLRPPASLGVGVFAFAPAVSLLFAAVLTVSFYGRVIDHRAPGVDHTEVGAGLVWLTLATLAATAAWLLWSFVRRRVSWLYLRGFLACLPVVALVAVSSAEEEAARQTFPPHLAPQLVELFWPEVLLVVVLGASLCAAVATERSPGLYRFLRTGVAPRRIRSRRVRALPLLPAGRAIRSYRLLAADEDAAASDEVRRALAAAAIEEATEGERDVVVLSDRTPAGWLSRSDLVDPIAVVATSISLPVRGALQRFQWVDYRARRRRTLEGLAHELAHGTAAAKPALPDVPESLQLLRLPRAVSITEWMLYCVAVVAADTGIYSVALAVAESRRGDAWPSGLCLLVAPVPALLALRLRRRRLTPTLLVAVLGLCWLAIIVLGLDSVLRDLFSTYHVGSHSALTVIYPAASALVVVLSWTSLRRWLPRRLPRPAAGQASLGHSGRSRAWLVLLIPALASMVGWAYLNSNLRPGAVGASSATAIEDMGSAAFTREIEACADRGNLTRLVAARFAPVNAQMTHATTPAKVSAAVARRIRVATRLMHALERYETQGSWGATIQKRLIVSLGQMTSDDRAYLHHQISRKTWDASPGRLRLSRAIDDLAKPNCN